MSRTIYRLAALMALLAAPAAAGVDPKPVINDLAPGRVTPGEADFVLSINGSGFTLNSAVMWDDKQEFRTSFVSALQLKATVPARLVASDGEATVSVTDPEGKSNAVTIKIESPTIFSAVFEKASLNLICSTIVLAFGLAIYWFWHPSIFHTHTFTERAFEFYLLKWVAYVMIWGLFSAHGDPRYVLATDDLNTVLGFAFVAAMWWGDSFEGRHRHVMVNLVFVFGLLFAWNFLCFPTFTTADGQLPSHEGLRWVLPSMTAAVLFIVSAGIAAVARCGTAAIPYAFAIALYCFLQLPTYELMYKIGPAPGPDGQELVKALAYAKLLSGGLFYQMFPNSVKKFDSIRISLPLDSRFAVLPPMVRRSIKWASLTIAGFVLTEFFRSIAGPVWQFVRRLHS
jgi:predicted membrane protein